jgi:hypothetical protein
MVENTQLEIVSRNIGANEVEALRAIVLEHFARIEVGGAFSLRFELVLTARNVTGAVQYRLVTRDDNDVPVIVVHTQSLPSARCRKWFLYVPEGVDSNELLSKLRKKYPTPEDMRPTRRPGKRFGETLRDAVKKPKSMAKLLVVLAAQPEESGLPEFARVLGPLRDRADQYWHSVKRSRQLRDEITRLEVKRKAEKDRRRRAILQRQLTDRRESLEVVKVILRDEINQRTALALARVKALL